ATGSQNKRGRLAPRFTRRSRPVNSSHSVMLRAMTSATFTCGGGGGACCAAVGVHAVSVMAKSAARANSVGRVLRLGPAARPPISGSMLCDIPRQHGARVAVSTIGLRTDTPVTPTNQGCATLSGEGDLRLKDE